MNNDSGFEILIFIVLAMIPQGGLILLKSQDLMIYFCLGELETLPKFHLRAIQIKSEIFLLQDQTGQINILTREKILEL